MSFIIYKVKVGIIKYQILYKKILINTKNKSDHLHDFNEIKTKFQNK